MLTIPAATKEGSSSQLKNIDLFAITSAYTMLPLNVSLSSQYCSQGKEKYRSHLIREGKAHRSSLGAAVAESRQAANITPTNITTTDTLKR